MASACAMVIRITIVLLFLLLPLVFLLLAIFFTGRNLTLLVIIVLVRIVVFLLFLIFFTGKVVLLVLSARVRIVVVTMEVMLGGHFAPTCAHSEGQSSTAQGGGIQLQGPVDIPNNFLGFRGLGFRV